MPFYLVDLVNIPRPIVVIARNNLHDRKILIDKVLDIKWTGKPAGESDPCYYVKPSYHVRYKT
jgi:hypothetical protein